MTDTLISTIEKNRRERFQVAIRTFKGRRMVDLRVYADNGVETVATAKGVAIRPELIGDIISALEAARTAADAEGLLR